MPTPPIPTEAALQPSYAADGVAEADLVVPPVEPPAEPPTEPPAEPPTEPPIELPI